MSAHSEDGRKIVHIATGAFALLLYYLTWWQSALLALLAVAFNVLVLPALAPRLYRPAERGRRTGGIVLYPVAVLALIVVFRERLDFAAAAWGIPRRATAPPRSWAGASAGGGCRGTPTRRSPDCSRSSCPAEPPALCSPGGAAERSRPSHR
jgi:hypothetical protein